MKKKWIIALSCVLVVVITIIILSFTLFTVQKVEIDMRTSAENTYTAEEILKTSNLSKGQNIMFLNKKEITDKLEKSYPYMEVINIETKFPYTLVFHLAERTGFYAIKSGDSFLKLDKDLKVLEDCDSADGLISLDGEFNLSVGDFAEIEGLKEFYDAVLSNNRTPEQALSTFKSIEFFQSENEIYHTNEMGLKLTLYSGREVFLHNYSYLLEDKLAKFYAVLGEIYSLTNVLDEDVVKSSQIHINNYIGSAQEGQNCYFYLTYQGEKVSI